jgi:hypothetical protein
MYLIHRETLSPYSVKIFLQVNRRKYLYASHQRLETLNDIEFVIQRISNSGKVDSLTFSITHELLLAILKKWP